MCWLHDEGIAAANTEKVDITVSRSVGTMLVIVIMLRSSEVGFATIVAPLLINDTTNRSEVHDLIESLRDVV